MSGDDPADVSATTDGEPGGGDLRLRLAAEAVRGRLFQRSRPASRIGSYAVLGLLGEGASGSCSRPTTTGWNARSRSSCSIGTPPTAPAAAG